MSTDWRPPETAPIDGSEFLAELSNGWVTILYANQSVREKWRYSWWSVRGGASVPYEPTHPTATDFLDHQRLTGWMPLPKSRQQLKRDEERDAE